MIKKVFKFFVRHKSLAFVFLLLTIYLGAELLIKADPNKKTIKNLSVDKITTYPADQETEVGLDSQIIIYLPEQIDYSQLDINIDPYIKLFPKWQKNKLVLDHQNLFSSNTKYQIKIKNIKTKKQIYSFSFRTLSLQSDPAFVEELRKEQKEKYPMMQYFPYWETSFLIEYINPLHLQITYYSSQGEQKAQEWLDNYKDKLKNHQIDWQKEID